LEQYKSSPLITPAVLKSAEKFDAPVTNFVAEGLKGKDLKKVEANILTEFFNSNVSAAAKLQASKSKKKFSGKDLESLRDMAWSAMKSKG
jgi:hypothetical protein